MAREKRIQERTASLPNDAERKKVQKQMEAAEPLPRATLAQVIEHIEHVRKVAGADHIGIGGDFDGMDLGPAGLEDVSKYPDLFAELVRRGWSDADLRKLAGDNLLRVMRHAEAVSRRLRAARPASTATIESMDGAPVAKAN